MVSTSTMNSLRIKRLPPRMAKCAPTIAPKILHIAIGTANTYQTLPAGIKKHKAARLVDKLTIFAAAEAVKKIKLKVANKEKNQKTACPRPKKSVIKADPRTDSQPNIKLAFSNTAGAMYLAKVFFGKGINQH